MLKAFLVKIYIGISEQHLLFTVTVNGPAQINYIFLHHITLALTNIQNVLVFSHWLH
jgi:hypothetical protein